MVIFGTFEATLGTTGRGRGVGGGHARERGVGGLVVGWVHPVVLLVGG